MVVELFTLFVLVAALATKFLTSRRIEAFEVKKIEVKNEQTRLESVFNQACESRANAENRLRLFQHEKAELEDYLSGAEEELDKRIEQNEELEDR